MKPPDISGYRLGREGSDWASVKSAKDMVEVILKTAKQLLLKDGHHSPMIFAVTENEAIICPIGQFLQTEEGKDSVGDMVRSIIAKFNAQGIGMVTESWMVKAGDGVKSEDLLHIQASKHPARIEVLITSANWNDGSQYVRILRMVRDNQGKVTQLVELEDESGLSELSGRFTNFFDKSV